MIYKSDAGLGTGQLSEKPKTGSDLKIMKHIFRAAWMLNFVQYWMVSSKNYVNCFVHNIILRR